MINFRYHVVSLTSVFLALAVGLVLGSTVLNGPMLDALNNQVNTLGKDNSQLRDQVSFLEEEANRDEGFAVEAAPRLLDGTLAGRRVALVVLPTAEDYAEEYPAGVVESLDLAGATVTGTVTLTERFFHPQHRLHELLDVAHQALPPSVDAADLPSNSDGVETSAALLAAVLLDDAAAVAPPEEADSGQEEADSGQEEADSGQEEADSGQEADEDDSDAGGEADSDAPDGAGPDEDPLAVPAADRRSVLRAYTAAEYLTVDEPVEHPAEILVVVAGLPVTDGEPDERNPAMLTAVSQFGAAKGTDDAPAVVLAGAGPSGDGNVVAEVRADPALNTTISTVDNASTPQGQIALGLVVAQQLSGTVGHYGLGDGVELMLPERSERTE